MDLIFITGNKDKFSEASRIILGLLQQDLDLPETQSLDSQEIIKSKLEEAKKYVKGSFLVEDVSFAMSCLKGMPGPLIKWFLKTIGTEGLVKLAKTHNNFDAEIKVTIGVYFQNGKVKFFDGTSVGKVVEPRGNLGWGFDPIFQPDSSNKTYGEMTLEEKNNFSMRKIAFQKLKDYLEKNNYA